MKKKVLKFLQSIYEVMVFQPGFFCEPGIAPIHACYKGEYYAIQPLKKDQALNVDQRLFKLVVERSGGYYICVRNIEDLYKFFPVP